MKTVGIIGGLGPETTAKFYLEVIRLCLAKDQFPASTNSHLERSFAISN